MILFKVLILLVMGDIVSAIIGYDCGTNSLNITTISLLDIDDCDVDTDEVTPVLTDVFLLQTNEYKHVDIFQCKVEIVRTVTNCGMHSHNSIVENGYMEYIQPISRESCHIAHNHGTIRVFNAIVDGLLPNTTTTRSITFAGRVKNDGTCSGTQYSDPYGNWDSVVVTGIARITLKSMTTRVKIDNSRVHMPSGFTCELRSGHCVDPEGGHTFWNPLPVGLFCPENFYSLLYKGPAIKFVSRNEIVYSVTVRDTSFSLTQSGTVESCGLKLIRTEHPKLLIIESKDMSVIEKNKAVKLNTDNMDLFVYVNAKFVYVERHIRQQLKELYRDVIYHRCNLERQILKNSLTIATIMPDEFAFRFMKSPGYMAVLAGEVAHIIQCIPVEVKIRHAETCYNRLPVLRGNETAYLTPRTHVVVTQATQIPCNSPLLQYYQLGNLWYKLMPKPVETVPPAQIKPESKMTWSYKNPTYLATSGIYTEEDLEKMRDRIMFPMENSAMLNKMAQRISGNGTHYGSPSMYNLFDEGALEKLAENAWERSWGRFIKFGTVSAGFIGIFIVLRICKMIVDTLVHGYTLHTAYGWSIQLLGAVWDSITNLLLHMARRNENWHRQNNERDVEMSQIPTAPIMAESVLYPNLDKEDKPNNQVENNLKEAEKKTFV